MKKNVLLNELIKDSKCVMVPVDADSTKFADIATVSKLIPFDFTTEINTKAGLKKMAFAEKEISSADLKQFKEDDTIISLTIESIFNLIDLEENAVVIVINKDAETATVLETIIDATLQCVCELDDIDEELGSIEKTIKTLEDGTVFIMISRISNQYAMTVLDSKIAEGTFYTLEEYTQKFVYEEPEEDENFAEVTSRDEDGENVITEGYEESEEDEVEDEEEFEEEEEEDDEVEDEEEEEDTVEDEVIETKAFNSNKYPAKKKKKH